MFERKTAKETCEVLKTSDRWGLTDAEVKKRLAEDGPNVLKETKKRTAFATFIEQLNDPLIYVLLAAAAVSLLLHEVSDALIILFVVCLNAIVGVIQEGKAQKALDSLKNLTRPMACVIRDGREAEIPAAELVRGDLVCLEAGRQVPADLRLTESKSLQIEESTLTGEAVPVMKDAGWRAPLDKKETLPGDCHNMAFMSTIVTGGRGKGVVTAVGMETQIGRIASMMEEDREEATPLQKKLGELGKWLSLLSLAICAMLFLIAVIQKRNVFEMLLTAISLAVAAVPEGLPAVVTLCLALSVTRMVKVNTIIRRLPSVETLGCVNIVCSDKTGTLTLNRMTAERCFLNLKLQEADKLEEPGREEFLNAMALCNDAVMEDSYIGDPTELALLALAASYGKTRRQLEERLPRRGEIAFDSDRKMMSTFHAGAGEKITYTKGAPDRVLQRCSGIMVNGRETALSREHKKRIEAAIDAMSKQALRTLAVACRKGQNGPEEKNLVFLGLVGMKDPIRPEAAGAVQTFLGAGVSTVMITGDHVETAFAIGRQLGIADSMEQCMTGEEILELPEDKFLERLKKVRVFARVSPANKVEIVKGFQKLGNVVAMTGDGVNDAPSLKAADVGVAMGKGGTDVARQASDLILTDDNFATIEKAIEEGRGVYENIKKSVIFLLSSNLGEIMTMFAAVLFKLVSPLKSSHILWINLITDSLPALALGVDLNDGKELMKRPPRKADESLFADGGMARTLLYGTLIAGISLTAFFTVPWNMLKASGMPFSLEAVSALLTQKNVAAKAQTYAFTVLGMSQLFHAIGMRDVHKSVLFMDHLENKMMIAACVLGFILQAAVTEIPFLIKAFGTARLTQPEWLYLAGLAAFPLLAHELLVLLSGEL